MSGTANYGYGICGHKNNFSTKILNGNWVEDRIGMRLASSRPEPNWDGLTTDTRENFINPALMGDKQTRDCPPIDNVAIEAGRKGLSADTLFGHGKAATNGGLVLFSASTAWRAALSTRPLWMDSA